MQTFSPKGMKWNNADYPKTFNFASETKKTAHNVATFKIISYLCGVIQRWLTDIEESD